MHQYFHTTLGFCLWDLLALLVFAVILVMLAVHLHKQKKRQRDLEEQLAAKQAQESWLADGRRETN